MLTRRAMLNGTALTVVGGILEACASGTTPTVTPAQVVTDSQNAISALANSFKAVLVQAPNAIPAATSATISSALAQASAVLGSLSTSLTATQGAPIVQQVEQAINTVISAAAAVPLIPVPFSTALGAAAIVLPVIEAWVNSILPAPAPAAAMMARAKLATPGMSVSDAEATLKSLAGK